MKAPRSGTPARLRPTLKSRPAHSGLGLGNPSIVNTGLFEKTAGAGETSINGPSFESSGTVNAASGKLGFPTGSVAFSTGSAVNGAIALRGATVTGGSFNASAATVTISSGSLTLTSGSTATIGTFVMQSSSLVTGPGTLDVSTTFTSEGGRMTGTGSTVILPGASGTMGSGESIFELWKRTLLNEGTITSNEGTIFMDEGALFENAGTFKANAENPSFFQFDEGGFGNGYIVNTGLFEKTKGTEKTVVKAFFSNFGAIEEHTTGTIEFREPVRAEESTLFGEVNPSAVDQEVSECGEGVNCATGNLSETQTDFAVGGRGVGLDLTRTYNSQAAAKGVLGAFGYGWSSSFSDHLVVEEASKKAVLYQANGSTVPFTESGGAFTAPEWSQDTLSGSKEAGYSLTLANQTVYKFAGATGRLESVTDRNGNATTLTYNEGGQLTTITDPASRTIKLAYNGEGLVESAEDPMKHVVKYTYKEKQLASVTQPAEAGLRWQFAYDGSHQLTELTDGRGNKSTIEYTEPSGHQADRQPETRNDV